MPRINTDCNSHFLRCRPSGHETWCRETVCIFSEEADSVSLLVFINKVYRFRIQVCVARF